MMKRAMVLTTATMLLSGLVGCGSSGSGGTGGTSGGTAGTSGGTGGTSGGTAGTSGGTGGTSGGTAGTSGGTAGAGGGTAGTSGGTAGAGGGTAGTSGGTAGAGGGTAGTSGGTAGAGGGTAGTSGGTAGAGGGTAGTSGTAGAGGGSVSCDAFTNAGTAVTSTSNPAAPPTMMGGPLAGGTYVLTSFVEYNGNTNSSTHKETFVFANGTVKHAGSENGAADTFLAGTYTTSGTLLTLNLTCPSAMTVPLQYTATPTTFEFIAPNNSSQLQTYAKQ